MTVKPFSSRVVWLLIAAACAASSDASSAADFSYEQRKRRIGTRSRMQIHWRLQQRAYRTTPWLSTAAADWVNSSTGTLSHTPIPAVDTDAATLSVATDSRSLLFVRGGASASTTSSSSSSSSASRSAFNIKTRPVSTITSSSWPPRRTDTTATSSSAAAAATTTASALEDAKETLDAFLTRDSRNSFIARVYAILSVQLTVTALSVVVFGLNPQLGMWMRPSYTRNHRVGSRIGTCIPFVSLLLSTLCWVFMCSSVRARQQSPLKWQVLALFTLGEALSVGFVSSFYTFKSVGMALLATATAATGVSLYTITQKNPHYDLSQWGAGLSSAGLIFVVYGILQLLIMVGVLPQGLLPYNDMLYGMVGAILFSFYLAYHTKLIVAGKHTKYQMNEKDYVFGAMTLYNDIVNIFIYVLRLIGEDRDHNHRRR